jgi:hypothetical protein
LRMKLKNLAGFRGLAVFEVTRHKDAPAAPDVCYLGPARYPHRLEMLHMTFSSYAFVSFHIIPNVRLYHFP